MEGIPGLEGVQGPCCKEGFLEGETESTSETPDTSIGQIVSSVGDSNSMRISICIKSCKSNKTIEAAALIDSGAAGEFIDWGFVRKNLISTRSIPSPIVVRNVDGTSNK